MGLIIMHPEINPYAFTTVRQYRGYSQSKLCKSIKGLSQSNLSDFEKGKRGKISIEKLKEIMKFLDWPFDFLYKEIESIKYFCDAI